jgi:hypothetical protein
VTDALSQLWSLLEAPALTVAERVVRRWPENEFTHLSNLGVLVPGPDADRVVCPECHRHVEELVVLDGPGDLVRYFVSCPRVGRVPVPPRARRQWSVNLNGVAALLATALRVTGKISELVPDRLWRLGRTMWNGHSRDVLLARGLDWEDAAHVKSVIAQGRKPIVLVAETKPPDDQWLGRIPPILVLSEVARLQGKRIDIDSVEIVASVTEAEAKAISKESKQNEKLRLMIRQQVAAHSKTELTDEFIVNTYRDHGSLRKAAVFLSKRLGRPISKDRVEDAVKRAGGVAAVCTAENSDSLIRSVASQSRDRRGKRLIQSKSKMEK